MKNKKTTIEKAKEIVMSYIPAEDSFMNFRNLREHSIMNNTYRFTVDIVSLDFLISLMEDESILNVYFNPSVPPPGTGIDGISLRYKIYVQFDEDAI